MNQVSINQKLLEEIKEGFLKEWKKTDSFENLVEKIWREQLSKEEVIKEKERQTFKVLGRGAEATQYLNEWKEDLARAWAQEKSKKKEEWKIEWKETWDQVERWNAIVEASGEDLEYPSQEVQAYTELMGKNARAAISKSVQIVRWDLEDWRVNQDPMIAEGIRRIMQGWNRIGEGMQAWKRIDEQMQREMKSEDTKALGGRWTMEYDRILNTELTRVRLANDAKKILRLCVSHEAWDLVEFWMLNNPEYWRASESGGMKTWTQEELLEMCIEENAGGQKEFMKLRKRLNEKQWIREKDDPMVRNHKGWIVTQLDERDLKRQSEVREGEEEEIGRKESIREWKLKWMNWMEEMGLSWREGASLIHLKWGRVALEIWEEKMQSLGVNPRVELWKEWVRHRKGYEKVIEEKDLRVWSLIVEWGKESGHAKGELDALRGLEVEMQCGWDWGDNRKVKEDWLEKFKAALNELQECFEGKNKINNKSIQERSAKRL